MIKTTKIKIYVDKCNRILYTEISKLANKQAC